MKKSLNELLKEKKHPIGIFINTGCPEMVEICGQTGFNFIIIDNEHGSWDGEHNSHMIRAAETFDTIPLVRVSGADDEDQIKHILDLGAAGIVVPGIKNAEDARTAIRNAKFTPMGDRGACPYVRANRYTGISENYYEKSNRETTVMLMIEGVDGIENFDEIIGVEGVDVIFFGPYDLSVSLGIPGQTDDERVSGTIKKLILRAKEYNIKTCMLGIYAEDTNKWFDCGADFVVAVGDMAFFYRSCANFLKDVYKD